MYKTANVYLVHDVVIVLGRPEDLRSEEVALDAHVGRELGDGVAQAFFLAEPGSVIPGPYAPSDA